MIGPEKVRGKGEPSQPFFPMLVSDPIPNYYYRELGLVSVRDM